MSATLLTGPYRLLDDAARRHPDAPALVLEEGTTVSYGELDVSARRAARWLRRHGVGRGDRVVTRMRNSAPAVAVAFAVWRLGATLVPTHPQSADAQLESIAADCRPVLVVDGEGPERTVAAADAVRPESVLGGGDPDDGAGPEDLGDDRSGGDSGDTGTPGHSVDDLVCLMYTSGSTAAPKGVRCPAAAVDAALEAIAGRLGYRAGDRVALLSPLSFDYGLYQVFLTFREGATLVLADASRVTVMLRSLRDADITVLPVVPAVGHMLHALVRRGGPIDSVRLITSTGADLSAARIAELREVFPRAGIVPMYGITECKRVTIADPDVDLARPRSVGTALPGTRVEIHDDAGTPLAAGEVGQIVVYGPHVMDGYWEQPEMTAQRYGVTAAGERYLRTGDYGHLDADGHLYFEGRRDDIFKTKGVRASATEIAAAVEKVPGVREVVVLPPTDARGLAVVVSGDLTPAAVIDGVHDLLEPQKVPDECVVVDRFPLTSNGKIDTRRVLRDYEETT